ncbi:MAG: hypothetical protein HOH96_06690, partial [Flavobacteriales bacterium]|nr:hypothetical protein [Flavobacteriales bacterium]
MATPGTTTSTTAPLTRPTPEEEINNLDWRTLKARCQGAGIVTIGRGRTRQVLVAELKGVVKARQEADVVQRSESEEGMDKSLAEERSDSEGSKGVDLADAILAAQNEERIAKAKYESLVLKRKEIEQEQERAEERNKKKRKLFTPMLGLSGNADEEDVGGGRKEVEDGVIALRGQGVGVSTQVEAVEAGVKAVSRIVCSGGGRSGRMQKEGKMKV